MSIFSDTLTFDPYWWDAAPPQRTIDSTIPTITEVAIVGSGYCGLTAALELSRSGMQVDVLEAGPLGVGASSRSGGMVSSGQKLVLKGALRSIGSSLAAQALEDSRATYQFLQDLIARESLDADLQICGRFFGAFTPSHYERLKHQSKLLQEKTGISVKMLTRNEQVEEINTDFYCGGMLIESYGGLHPAKYNRSLRQAAARNGARLHPYAKVEGWSHKNGYIEVKTARGTLLAKNLIVATNAYTTPEFSWFRRRLVPVSSYMMATEPLPSGMMESILARPRMISDTRRELTFFRPSPDGSRFLFGGRASPFLKGERHAAVGLHARMTQIWPQLRDVKISHAWRGQVAMTFDGLPHLGQHEGLHYAIGCNGNGVALMSWLGHQIALNILGRQNRPSAFQDRPFPTSALYTGRPWFLPLVSAWYHLRDFLDRPRAVLQERSLRRK